MKYFLNNLVGSNRMKRHWDKVYKTTQVDKLGWYEEKPVPSLSLLSRCNINKNDSILDVGCGATTFIDYLIEEGFKNIIGVDISEIALSKLKERLGEKTSSVRLILDDITQPVHINNLKDISVWHDRALLHFLLEEAQQQSYLAILKNVVRKDGYVIIATFSLNGAKRCSGLDVKRYDQNLIAKFLGDNFVLIEYFEHIHHMPFGEERLFIYTLFRRSK